MHKSIKIHLLLLVSTILFPNKYADSQQIESPGEVYRELTPKIPDLRPSPLPKTILHPFGRGERRDFERDGRNFG